MVGRHSDRYSAQDAAQFVSMRGVFAMRITAVGIFAIGLALAVAGAAVSQESNAPSRSSGMSPQRLERVTGAMERAVAKGEVAGAVALVYRHGTIAYVSARGFQDKEAG